MSTNGSPPSDGTSGIEIRALTKCFAHNQHPALDGLSAVIRTGRITGLVGPDGAGKTTLLRLIAGLLEPTSGTISVFGFDTVRQTDSIKPLLGYMPQKFGLYEDLTVQENLELYAELRGLPCDEKKSRFDELLRFTSLGPVTDRLAGRLSGGMKQKLGLACALIKMPRLLILDEPGVGVDPISRRELWRMARDMVTDQVIILWSTAYLNEAQMCDEVLLLEEGKELFFGTPAELMSSVNGRVIHITGLEERKRRAHLAVLLRDERVRDGTIQGDGLRIILDRPPARFSGDLFPTPPGRFAEVSPRFEDGYIDILGGIGSRQSPITKAASSRHGGSPSATGTSPPPIISIFRFGKARSWGSSVRTARGKVPPSRCSAACCGQPREKGSLPERTCKRQVHTPDRGSATWRRSSRSIPT